MSKRSLEWLKLGGGQQGWTCPGFLCHRYPSCKHCQHCHFLRCKMTGQAPPVAPPPAQPPAAACAGRGCSPTSCKMPSSSNGTLHTPVKISLNQKSFADFLQQSASSVAHFICKSLRMLERTRLVTQLKPRACQCLLRRPGTRHSGVTPVMAPRA